MFRDQAVAERALARRLRPDTVARWEGYYRRIRGLAVDDKLELKKPELAARLGISRFTLWHMLTRWEAQGRLRRTLRLPRTTLIEFLKPEGGK